jgi:scyllo-inositol 2-dehydrogenase (NADP+)
MSKPISVAIASYGMSGMLFHAPMLQVNPNFDLVCIQERSSDKSKSRYPFAKIVRSFEDILADKSIELVVVNTPDKYHYPMALQAIDAGKHVVVEKPFTQELWQAKELISRAQEKGVILSVFQNRRWDGDFLTVQKVIEQQVLGRLVEFESHFDRYRNFIQEGNWKEDPDNGTGTLYNLGSHMIDQVLTLFGKPARIWADLHILRTGGMVDDCFELKLEYPGMKVTTRGSYLVREPGPRFILHGTQGSFLKWGSDPQEEALKAGVWPNQENWGSEPESDWGLLNTSMQDIHYRGKVETLPGNYNAYYDNLYSAIRQGKELAVKPEEAMMVIQVIDAAMTSVAERKWVNF